MHVIESSGISTKLWRNASYISNTPDITVSVTASEVAVPVPSSDLQSIDDFRRNIRISWLKPLWTYNRVLDV